MRRARGRRRPHPGRPRSLRRPPRPRPRRRRRSAAMNAVALLIAAGGSERMGSPKALLPWRGQPLLSHQLQQIQKSRIADCVVVLGPESERLETLVAGGVRWPAWKARVVRNLRYREGKTV